MCACMRACVHAEVVQRGACVRAEACEYVRRDSRASACAKVQVRRCRGAGACAEVHMHVHIHVHVHVPSWSGSSTEEKKGMIAATKPSLGKVLYDEVVEADDCPAGSAPSS